MSARRAAKVARRAKRKEKRRAADLGRRVEAAARVAEVVAKHPEEAEIQLTPEALRAVASGPTRLRAYLRAQFKEKSP